MKKFIAALGVAAVASVGSAAYAFVPTATDLSAPEPIEEVDVAEFVPAVEAPPSAVPDYAPVTVHPPTTQAPALHPEPGQPPEPEPTLVTTVPLPGLAAVTLQGDVSLNGTTTLPDVLFGVVWDVDNPSHAQLWAVLEDQPVLVCDGTIHELDNEPVYHAQSQLLGNSGRCHGQRVPDGGDGVAVFLTFSDGQWAAATLTSPDGVPTVALFD